MSEEQTTQNKNEEKVVEQVESTKTSASTEVRKKPRTHLYIAAFAVVALIILGVLYSLEKQDRSPTNIFSSVIAGQAAAYVNDTKITNDDLFVSSEQLKQIAAAQGADVSDPEVQTAVREQALEVLINTALLKQAAEDRGITVADEEVKDQIEIITTDVGGEEALTERMNEMSISEDQLNEDVRDDILIQGVLDTIFAEQAVAVSDEEIAEYYDAIVASNADNEIEIPTLEDLRDRIEGDLVSSKEQEAIDIFLTEAREAAEIEIK